MSDDMISTLAAQADLIAELEDLITDRNIEAALMAAEHTRLREFLTRIANTPWSKEEPVSLAREALALKTEGGR